MKSAVLDTKNLVHHFQEKLYNTEGRLGGVLGGYGLSCGGEIEGPVGTFSSSVNMTMRQTLSLAAIGAGQALSVNALRLL